MGHIIKVPSPAEVLKSSQSCMSDTAYKLLKAVIAILREKYVGKKLTVKLKEIKAKAGIGSTTNDDWEKMEFELRKVGWFVSYDGPGWDESYDAFYEIGAKNK